MSNDTDWLEWLTPYVREQLPAAPARVLEVGCGPYGGFVPALREAGYRAVGVDPEAPDGDDFRQVSFEEYDPPHAYDAVIACLSLHHVPDPEAAAAKLAELLAPDGVVVVVELAWERHDAATVDWWSARLGPAPDDLHSPDASFLHRHLAAWRESGQPWESYFRAWATEHGMHPADQVVAALDRHFTRRDHGTGPYLFTELPGVTEQDERDAIAAGLLQPLGVRYVGSHRAGAAASVGDQG
ncbi:MAG: class I SAM-dependent methyltransferase [Micromonosporaceae bacterium]